MNFEPVNIALLGCGYWGANLCRVLAGHPEVKLSWIVDASEPARSRGSRLAPEAKLSADLAPVLEDARVSGVVIATPVTDHHASTLRVLNAGKGALVEKPLARTATEAADLCRAAQKAGTILMVGHTFLYNGAVRRIKEMINRDELGDLRYVFCQRLNLGIVRKDVDVLWNLAPHDLSMLNYWIGRSIVEVRAVGHSFLQPGIADIAFAHIQFEDNISGHIHVSWLDPGKVRRATVVGSKRMLVYDDMSAEARITVYDKGIDSGDISAAVEQGPGYAQHSLMVRAGDAWLPRVVYPEPLRAEVDEYISCLRSGEQPLTDGQNGLAVVQTLELLSSAMLNPTGVSHSVEAPQEA